MEIPSPWITGALCLVLLTSEAHARSAYDGSWDLVFVTQAGTCDPNYNFTLARPDPSTLRISAEEWSHLYRQKSDVLVSVGVVGLDAADQIANNVLKIITDRIK